MNTDVACNTPDFEELSELIVLAGDQALTDQQTARLEELVVDNEEACEFYAALMHVQAGLRRRFCDPDATDSPAIESFLVPMPQVISPAPSATAHSLGFLGDAWQGTAAYFDFNEHLGRFSYLATSILFVIVWFVASHIYVTTHSIQNIAENSPNQTPSAIDKQLPSVPVVVGRIVDTVDCKFSVQGAETKNHKSKIKNQKSLVALGDKLILASGLMEIAYDTGARVILQGPCTYTVESTSGGFLAVGKLTARLEKQVASEKPQATSNPQSPIPNPSFFVRTPTAVVTDLGTEFGVNVNPDKTTTVHVIRGVVEATRNEKTGGTPIHERLTAGQAIYIASLNDLPQRIDLSENAAPQQRTGGRSVRVVLSSDLKVAVQKVREARNSQMVPAPIGLVATAYHRVWGVDGKLLAANDRNLAFRVATDGIFGRGVGGEKPRSSFDTQLVVSKTGGLGDGETGRHAVSVSQSPSLPVSKSAFVGLRYASPTRFDRIKVFLARQTEEGGGWAETPKLYILKNPVDTNQTPPEDDSANWREVSPQVLYGMFGSKAATPGPGAVLEFALTGLSAEDRTGYGWAIGGVPGNGSAGFISITELRAYTAPPEDQDSDKGG